jgi:chromosome segregation ATPase
MVAYSAGLQAPRVIAMSQNLLPALDLPEEAAAPVETDMDALGLHALLQIAFASDDVVSHTDSAPAVSAIDTAQTFAAAMLRQSEAFEKLQDRAVRLENGSDLGGVRQNVRDLCEALLQITVQAKNASAEVENRFEALSDAMAALREDMASQRQDIQASIAATTQLSQQIQQLQDEIAGQPAAEDAKLLERFGQLADELDTAKGQVAGLEDTVAALADSSIRSSEGLSVLGNALEAAKTQIFSLSETSVYLTERLRIAEQVVEESSRRDEIPAAPQVRAARTSAQ